MKTYDFEERTFIFARDVRLFLKKIRNNITNREDGRQLVKASGSVGANYIEANDALGDRDFIFRLKISRKEAKESKYWLRLLKATNDIKFSEELTKLIQESDELKRILSKMIQKLQIEPRFIIAFYNGANALDLFVYKELTLPKKRSFLGMFQSNFLREQEKL